MSKLKITTKKKQGAGDRDKVVLSYITVTLSNFAL
ncbi:MAG: hypothetical protein A4E53_01116 [Pelotomaculum sp. PtaB.Bin104]|nr:MAG: hypothetical protein A4E53_01116 [Pelotomaculum sp. PtaB.Bin104]